MSQLTLYKRNNSNLISWWRITKNELSFTIEWGQNAERENCTTDNFQVHNFTSADKCETEYNSRIAFQKDRNGYSDQRLPASPDFPMLCQEWEDHRRKVREGKREGFASVVLQPKVDGIRCISTRTSLRSRKNLPITSVPDIASVLSYLVDGVKFDGELYVPNTDLQTIQSLTLRNRPDHNHHCVRYYVFDVVNTELNFLDRSEILRSSVARLQEEHSRYISEYLSLPEKQRGKPQLPLNFPIVMVPTVHLQIPCYDKDFPKILEEYFTTWTTEGYEGVIIRNPQAVYELNYRSPDILKYKKVKSDEFEIIYVEEGANKTGKFVCKTDKGIIFDVDTDWTRERKQSILRNKETYVGRMLTVEFETYSPEGRPLKPKGKATRKKADM